MIIELEHIGLQTDILLRSEHFEKRTCSQYYFKKFELGEHRGTRVETPNGKVKREKPEKSKISLDDFHLRKKVLWEYFSVFPAGAVCERHFAFLCVCILVF